MAANNLSSYSVWAYTALFIPSAAQPGAFIHIVQPGETLYTIATNHGTTVALIMMANALQTYDIYVYQRLVIPPEGWTGWPPISYWTGPGGSFYSGSVYVVQMGDTLYGIAQRFGTTVASLMAANGLTSSTIIAGTTLRIP
jgi:LysM repeat protein